MNDYTVTHKNFYCNICHTRFEKGKNAIQMHERSQKHTRAKDKETKRLTKKNKEISDEQLIQQEREWLDARNRARYSGAPPPTKPTGSKGDKHGQAGAPGESGYGTRKDNKEPPQPLPRYELGLSLKENEGFAAGVNVFGGVWTLAKDDETGKLVFFNRKSGLKYPERPRGVKLSPQDEKKWEEYQNNPTQDVDVILNPETAQGVVGQWEEVEVTEDYYANNAVDPAELDIPEQEVEDEEEKKVEEQLEKLDEMNEDEINDLLNLDKAEEGKSLLRSKTDKLKKYIDANLEAVSKPTFQKDSDILFKRSLEDRGFNGDGNDAGKGGGLFKKKKVQENKRVILGFENENEIE